MLVGSLFQTEADLYMYIYRACPIEKKAVYNPFSCADPEGGGGQGVRPPPEKSQKYMVS